MLQIKKFVFNDFGENTFVLYDDSRTCVVIDPGCYYQEEKETLKSFIDEEGLTLDKVLLTHGHLDHVFGNAYVKRQWEVEIWMHQGDLPIVQMMPQMAGMYGFGGAEPSPEPDRFIEEGEDITFGNTTLKVIFVPGHSPGHVAFICDEAAAVFSGDLLFNGSIGRHDLPGGDLGTMERSIRDKMYALPEDYTVYCGHGPETTIGNEKYSNPFFREAR